MNGLSRRKLLAVAGGLVLAPVGIAPVGIAPVGIAPVGIAEAAVAQSDEALDQPLQGLYDGLTAAMKAGAAVPFSSRFDRLAPAVDGAFDLATVLKVSVGLRWNGMDPDVRDKLSKAFRRFTIATYVANFDKYNGEVFTILPGSREEGADRIVATEMAGAGQKVRLDYVMRAEADNWRAVDVLLEGTISRVAVQRSDFRKILAAGDAPALIADLNRKVVDLSNGALSS